MTISHTPSTPNPNLLSHLLTWLRAGMTYTLYTDIIGIPIYRGHRERFQLVLQLVPRFESLRQKSKVLR